MDYKYIHDYLSSINNLKTKDIVNLDKKLIKEHIDVSFLKNHCLEDELVQRTYFEVSMKQMNNYKSQFQFVEENQELLRNWWHVDQLTQYMIKPIDFDYAFNKAKKYIKHKNPFMRRWGYVLFLSNLEKDSNHTEKILSLMKDDSEYYVQMAEAWLICELAKYNLDAITKFFKNTKLKYNITGRAIQKICDSLVIDDETKKCVKTMREKLKDN